MPALSRFFKDKAGLPYVAGPGFEPGTFGLCIPSTAFAALA